MRYLFLIPFILLFANCTSGQQKMNTKDKLSLAMDEAMKSSDLPALVAIAIDKQGKKWVYTYGKAVWTEKELVSPRHIFRIFSMTKLMTSIAAMQLVEKGLIGLDDDLSKWLPEMTSIPILSEGKLIEPKKPITLRHLLTHTAGFGYKGTNESLAKFDTKDWKYKDLPRVFESGTDFLYGTCLNWVGRLVEKISNLNLEEYFRKNISNPLQMNRTFFNLPDSLKAYVVSAGHRGNDGKMPLQELPDRIPTKQTREYSGGGGLYASPEDFTRLLQCLLHNGTWEGVKILEAKTIEEMRKNQIAHIKMDISQAYFTAGSCCNFKGLISENTKWGLAWLIDNEPKAYGRQAGTVLWGGLMNTYFYIDYQSGIAVSIYTQHLPFNHSATMTLLDKFSELVYKDK